MPCYTIQETALELEHMEHGACLEALKNLGFRIQEHSAQQATGYCANTGTRAEVRDGRAVIFGTGRGDVDATKREIAQEYAAVQVERKAKRYGWAVQRTGPNQFKVRKR